MNTVDISGVEILRPGRWNGREYTTDQLAAMVDAFHDLKDVYAPPGKLGHNKEQALLANDGLPAAGWVKDLRMNDDRLVADFAKVPAKLGELIEAGAYRTRSAEVWFNADFDGKQYPAVLKAVSWLGADAPAVKGLGDICALYTEEQEPHGAEVHLAEADVEELAAIGEKQGGHKSPPNGEPTDKGDSPTRPTSSIRSTPSTSKRPSSSTTRARAARNTPPLSGRAWAARSARPPTG
jgi:hypothetical protein